MKFESYFSWGTRMLCPFIHRFNYSACSRPSMTTYLIYDNVLRKHTPPSVFLKTDDRRIASPHPPPGKALYSPWRYPLPVSSGSFSGISYFSKFLAPTIAFLAFLLAKKLRL